MKIYKPTPLKNLSWTQAKSRFPNMKPLGDADKDGVKNFLDCKPFDIKRQGENPKIDEIKKRLSSIISDPDEYADAIQEIRDSLK